MSVLGLLQGVLSPLGYLSRINPRNDFSKGKAWREAIRLSSGPNGFWGPRGPHNMLEASGAWELEAFKFEGGDGHWTWD